MIADFKCIPPFSRWAPDLSKNRQKQRKTSAPVSIKEKSCQFKMWWLVDGILAQGLSASVFLFWPASPNRAWTAWLSCWLSNLYDLGDPRVLYPNRCFTYLAHLSEPMHLPCNYQIVRPTNFRWFLISYFSLCYLSYVLARLCLLFWRLVANFEIISYLIWTRPPLKTS